MVTQGEFTILLVLATPVFALLGYGGYLSLTLPCRPKPPEHPDSLNRNQTIKP